MTISVNVLLAADYERWENLQPFNFVAWFLRWQPYNQMIEPTPYGLVASLKVELGPKKDCRNGLHGKTPKCLGVENDEVSSIKLLEECLK